MVLVNLNQNLMPTWVVIDEAGAAHVIATPWSSDQEKEQTAQRMRRILKNFNAKAYSMVTEAWTAKAPPEWKPGEPLIRPANRVDRTEVVIAFATDGQQIEWRQWQIKRDWNEQVMALEEQPSGKEHESWMSQLLTRKHA
jgi:hypothetical protein